MNFKTYLKKLLRLTCLICIIQLNQSCMSDSKPIEDINFSDGDYALYINHPKHGKFMVLDKKTLKENKNKLKVNVSWLTYLPGEGYRGYGFVLFKDHEPIKKKGGGIFNSFEIGNLYENAVPVESHQFHGVRSQIQQKVDSLSVDQNAYVTYKPDLPTDDKEFHFRVYFPSIAIPVTRYTDSLGYQHFKTVNGINGEEWSKTKQYEFEKQLSASIKQCIYNQAQQLSITNFDCSVSQGSQDGAYLFNVSTEQEVKDENNRILYINDFMYWNFQAYIGASQEDAQKLLNLDYSHCLTQETRNKPKLIETMKAKIAQSSTPNIPIENVGLTGYKDQITKSKKLYEQEYSIRWLEVELGQKKNS